MAYALDRNEVLFSEPYSKNLRDEVTLWVECDPRSTLDLERRLNWWLVQDPSGWGHPFRVKLHATSS